MRRLMPLATLLCLLLSRSAVADPKVIAKAQVVGTPFVKAIADDAQGGAVDKGFAQRVRDLITGTEWTLAETGLQIAKSGQLVMYSGFLQLSESTYWLHLREGRLALEGTLFRDSAKKTGYSEFSWTILSEDGQSSKTAFVSVDLSYAP
jgi:hypothetical protein